MRALTCFALVKRFEFNHDTRTLTSNRICYERYAGLLCSSVVEERMFKRDIVKSLTRGSWPEVL